MGRRVGWGHRGRAPATDRERVLGAVFGFDAGGGLWVNESVAGKRWYRRPGLPAWEPAAFAALHVHPFVVELASGRRSWARAAVTWALPVIASGVVAAVVEADRRPVAASLAWVVAGTGAALAPGGWRWLPALLAFKLVLGHATPAAVPAQAIDRVDGSSA
jgi:hypothetical protein